ncbi:MAG TPA: flagellar basal-body MS-ring/collar protein FliF [Acidobacteriota bacterium]|nr:flagellar basal-body MS-ring/collar protein FliF [Acidobacteriota bacterium]
MPGILAQFKALNDNLSVNQKLSIAVLGLVTLFGLLGFVYLINQQTYQLLISDLDAETAQQVVERLEQQDIAYKLSNSGRDILVPPESLNQAMLEIAGDGLVNKGRVGFEIFDENSWSMTEFGEQVKFQRALEGTLERTILELEEISKARVHVAFEKESLFSEQKQPAKASVVVGLRTGRSLPPKKVASIENLVASAVQGLSPDNVTVVGADGGLLSQERADTEMLNEQQIQLRQGMERELSEKVRRLLERTVGQSKVEVETSLVLDFSELRQKELIKDPVLLAEEETSRRGPGAQGAGGTPGVAANEGQEPQADEELSGTQVTQTRRNYEHSLLERSRTAPGGEIKRISMAVVIDHKSVPEQDEAGETVETRVPWAQEELDQLRNLVSSTIGFDAQRGDRLTLENIPLLDPVQPEMQAPVGGGFLQEVQPLLWPALRWMGILGLFLLFYLLIFRPVKRQVFTYVEANPPAQVTQGSGGARRQLADGSRRALPEAEGDVEIDADEQRRADLVDLARRKPETMTGLLRDWMSEQGV